MKKQKRILSAIVAAIMIVSVVSSVSVGGTLQRTIITSDRVTTIFENSTQFNFNYGFNEHGLAPVSSDSCFECRTCKEDWYFCPQRSLWGFINTKGEVVVPLEYRGDFIGAPPLFVNGLARVQNKDSLKWGFVNTRGEIILPFEYDAVYDFDNGLAAVTRSVEFSHYEGGYVLRADEIGFINARGEFVIPFGQYHYVPHGYTYVEFYLPAANDGVIVLKRGEWFFFDSVSGELLATAGGEIYTEFYSEWHGEIRYRYEGYYRQIRNFNNGLAAVALFKPDDDCRTCTSQSGDPRHDFDCKRSEKWGFFNKRGELVIPLEYSEVRDFRNGFAAVQKDGKWGFINTLGEVVVPFEYDRALDFSEHGVALVRKDFLWGVINARGEVVIPFEHGSAWQFVDGFAQIGSPGNQTYINTRGEIMDVFPFVHDYDEVGNFIGGFAEVRKGDKRGVVNTRGEVVAELRNTRGTFARNFLIERVSRDDTVFVAVFDTVNDEELFRTRGELSYVGSRGNTAYFWVQTFHMDNSVQTSLYSIEHSADYTLATPDLETALAILRYVVDLPTATPVTVETHDFDGNGTVEIADALLVLRYIIGLSSL